MDSLILTILFIVTGLSFIEDYMSDTLKKVIAVVLSLLLIAISSLKDISSTADSEVYETLFLDHDSQLIQIMTEPTFIYLSKLVYCLGGTVSVIFFIYALFTIPIKLTAIWKMTPYFFTAMIVYIGVYYPLHDIVQIRAGAAIALLLFSILTFTDRKYFCTFLLWLCALLFHYSSAAFLPVYFLGSFKMNSYWKWGLGIAVPFSLVLYMFGISVFSFFPSSWITGKLDFYAEGAATGNDGFALYIPWKQINFLAETALFYICLFFYDFIEKRNKYANIILKALALALIYFVVFAQIPVLGSRLHDLLASVSIIGFSFCVFLVKPNWIAKSCIFLFTVVFYILLMQNHTYFH